MNQLTDQQSRKQRGTRHKCAQGTTYRGMQGTRFRANSGVVYRTTRGAIAFGVVLALVLVLLGVGFMVMVLYMGGQNETKNAVDAGALNIGKQIIDNASSRLGIGFLDDKERIFYDVLADDPYKLIPDLNVKSSLRNINRVWGKAILIGINADAAEKEGNAGSATSNAQSAIEGAESLSNDLQKEVVDTTKWKTWFDDIAKQNSVRMLGKDASMVPLNPGQWQNSCMLRGAESNIQLFGDAPNFNLPPGYELNSDYYTSSTREDKDTNAQGKFFLKGYTPIQVAGKTVWQIPFPYDEKTHLVSGPQFTKEKPENEPLSWAKPIPNAFSAEGESKKSGGGQGEHAMSWVVANPHQAFRLAIPHSFLKIHVEKPKTHWKFFPYVDWVEFGDEQEYDFDKPDQTQTGPVMPAGGVGCVTSNAGTVNNIGADVAFRPLDWLLFPPEFKLTGTDFSPLENYMVNRINEMIPDAGTPTAPAKPLTADDLHDCLMNPLTIAYLKKGIQDYYIFSKDGKTITCQPEELAEVMAPWLRTDMNMIANDPDGTEKKVIDDANMPGLAMGDDVSSVPLELPIPFTNFLDIDWSTYDENVYWTPGSGYNGCLGTVRLERYTEIHTLSICVPL